MFGKNPKRKPINSDGNLLQIEEIFPTIQGEGANAGTPAVFIRLGGCNLACSFCDTEFESYKELKLGEVLLETLQLAKNSNNKITKKLIVITGGEPMRQPIELLCKQLLKLNFRVQIETNGTIFRDLPEQIEIVCSPKNTGKFYGKVNEGLVDKITSLKFIISKNNSDYQDVPVIDKRLQNVPIYIQPMDEYDKAKNKANIQHCIKLASEEGYLLSLQTHKIMDIR